MFRAFFLLRLRLTTEKACAQSRRVLMRRTMSAPFCSSLLCSTSDSLSAFLSGRTATPNALRHRRRSIKSSASSSSSSTGGEFSSRRRRHERRFGGGLREENAPFTTNTTTTHNNTTTTHLQKRGFVLASSNGINNNNNEQLKLFSVSRVLSYNETF